MCTNNCTYIPPPYPLVNDMKKDLQLWLKLFVFRFLVALCTFSAGHPDELWQFHEPAHAAVFGRGHLAWDWRARIRSYVFPLPLILAFHLAKWLRTCGLVGPGMEDAIVQMAPLFIRAFWAATTDLYTMKLCRKYFGPLAEKWGLLLSLSNPAQADIGTRALSNSAETALCAVVAYIWPRNRREWGVTKWMSALSVLGLTCLIRISAIQMFLPAALFLFLYVPNPLEIILTTIPVMAAVMLAGIAIDSYFYGELTVSWWNFFDWNVVQNISSVFGVKPFYFYFNTLWEVLLTNMLPLTAFGLFQSIAKWKSVFPFFMFVVPYFFFSSLQPHKEDRFLLPILPILLSYAAHGGQQLEVFVRKQSKYLKYSLKILLMAMVAYNSWDSLKKVSFTGVGPWNAIHDLRNRIKTAEFPPALPQPHGILLLAHCHNYPHYGVFHHDYPLVFIPCPPLAVHKFFKDDHDYDLNNGLAAFFYSGMIKETVEFYISKSKGVPPAFIAISGYNYLPRTEDFVRLGYSQCGKHANYILDRINGKDSSINDIFILCRQTHIHIVYV